MEYTYVINSVDEARGAMEVIFSKSGKQDVLVGVPIPLEGQDLDEFMALYAPIGIWAAEGKKIQTVQPGMTGAAPVEPVLSLTVLRSLAKMSRTEFFKTIKEKGWISSEDAILAARGELPASFDTALNDAVAAGYLSAERADDMRIDFAGASTIERNHPSLVFMQQYMAGQGQVVSDEDLDAMFGIV